MIGFIIGVFVGNISGVVLMALAFAASEADERSERDGYIKSIRSDSNDSISEHNG